VVEEEDHKRDGGDGLDGGDGGDGGLVKGTM